MPWHWEPMKDVVSCEKLRLVASRHMTRRCPNGAIYYEEHSIIH